MGLVGHQHGLVSALQEVAQAMVAAVEADGVGAVEPVHEGREVSLGGAEEEVIVVGHEAEGEEMELKARVGLFEQGQAGVAVVVVEKDVLPVVAPRGHVIDGVGELDAPGTRHDLPLAQAGGECKLN